MKGANFSTSYKNFRLTAIVVNNQTYNKARYPLHNGTKIRNNGVIQCLVYINISRPKIVCKEKLKSKIRPHTI